MDMFGEFQLKIITGSAKMVTPIFVKIPKKWGFTKMANFSRRNVYLAKSTFLEDANSEK